MEIYEQVRAGLPAISKQQSYMVAQCLRTGKLKIDPAKKIKEPCTLQDACNYVRNDGLGRYTREILSYIVEDFREMDPRSDYNYCCGGGFNGVGLYRGQRNVGLKHKLDQIRATGATLVISPCDNCWDAIRDMMEVYEVHDIKCSFLKPLLVDMLELPDNIRHDGWRPSARAYPSVPSFAAVIV